MVSDTPNPLLKPDETVASYVQERCACQER